MFSVYVCVFWDQNAWHFFVKRYFWEFKMLFGSLVVLHSWFHSYLCFSLLEKLFLSNLDTSSTPGLSIKLFNWFLSQSRYLPIARWIDRETFYPLDSSSIPPQSIETALLWTLGHLSIAASVEAFKAQHLFRYFSTPLFVEIY